MSVAHDLSERPMRRLAAGVTAALVAREAREAGLLFMNGSAYDWTKRELAEWLSGPYARVTSYARTRLHDRRRAHRSTVSEAEVGSILLDARWHVLAELEAAALPLSRPEFGDRMLTLGLVIPARADDGIAWLPVAGNARLHMRVLSLFAADALARPRDYARALHVCHRCEAVTFDTTARIRGNCGRHDLDVVRHGSSPHES